MILFHFLHGTFTKSILNFFQRQQEKSFNSVDWQFAIAISKSPGKTKQHQK